VADEVLAEEGLGCPSRSTEAEAPPLSKHSDSVLFSVWLAEGRMTVGEAVSKQSGFPATPEAASGIPDEDVAMEREATEADEAPEERGSDGAREAGMPVGGCCFFLMASL